MKSNGYVNLISRLDKTNLQHSCKKPEDSLETRAVYQNLYTILPNGANHQGSFCKIMLL